jgi:hypothetical protein
MQDFLRLWAIRCLIIRNQPFAQIVIIHAFFGSLRNSVEQLT